MHVLAMLFVLAVASFALAVIFVKFETHSTPRPRVIARVAACPARSDNVVSLPVRPRALAA